MIDKKRKSHKRWEKMNHLVDNVLSSIQSPAAVSILWVAFRHANLRDEFRISFRQIAKLTGYDPRHVRRALDQMVQAGVIEIIQERRGTIPVIYKITGNAWKPSVGVQTHTSLKT
jgi:DNA-binding MarR family transcriptional regulator